LGQSLLWEGSDFNPDDQVQMIPWTARTQSYFFLGCEALFLVFWVLLSPSLLPIVAHAESPKERYRKLQKEMETHREKLEKAKRLEHSALEDLDTVNRRLSTIKAVLRAQQKRIRQTEAEIGKMEGELGARREVMEREKRWVKRKLQAMQRYGLSGDVIILLASADDITGLMRRLKYLERIAVFERRLIENYAKNLRWLSEKEKQLQNLRAELKGEEERMRVTAASLSDERSAKETLIASIRQEKTTQEKMIGELQEASRRLLDIIKRLEERETYDAKGFSALKGKLPWPVDGKVVIPFGSQRDPQFKTPVFRNGLYIKTEEDSVRAIYTGKVVFADWFKGFGNLLIINHGEGYHTLYANLSEIFFKVGDIIKINDIVGKIGESGTLDMPSLYFEVRYKGKPLDPMRWLKKK
jgi:murein hydrolase activator